MEEARTGVIIVFTLLRLDEADGKAVAAQDLKWARCARFVLPVEMMRVMG
jgi:hypothetical protein